VAIVDGNGERIGQRRTRSTVGGRGMPGVGDRGIGEAAIGVDEEGRTISERMGKVEYQLWENGGSSMKDQMNETAELAKTTAIEVGFIKQVMLRLVELPDISYVQESAQEEKAVAKRGSKKAKNPAQ
jgi:ribosomal protein L15